ncbi:MAG: molybdopterin-dependent oxidoreductase [Candidatus Lokiarchaeota archaeon]|nr:molybdopterin-dependent oxidoreductase [Candidatus Lokiarchaeota archaeon]MBD3341286.1 molybdopterin-dependent oxidoreductase [Candidatus Lokiarchaeota archaeon]
MAKDKGIKFVRTACPAHCGIDACGILAHVKDDKIIKLEPADFPLERDRRICLRGLSSLDITYHPDRLKYPLKRVGNRGEADFERISWNEAFDIIADSFQSIAEKYGWKSIGWVLGGPGAGQTKFAAYLRLASLTQSTRVSAWGYGDAGLPCGSRVIFGSQFPYIYLFGTFWQRKWPELLVIWGTNPAESMPLQTMRKVLDAKEEKGTKVVVIDPRFTATASKADVYVGLKPGTDAALALGLMRVIFKEGLYDENFIRKETNGCFLVRNDNGKLLRGKDMGEKKKKATIAWIASQNAAKVVRRSTFKKAAITGTYRVNGIECKTAFQTLMDLAEEYTLEKTSEITGVAQDKIESLARAIGNTKKVNFFTYMGFTRTYHGDISLRGLATVASVTGHVSTAFSSGYVPAVLNWDPFLKARPDKPSYHRLGILKLYNAVIKGDPYPIKAVWFSFINFLNQCVDCNKLINEFFPKLDFIVQTELFMTPTAKYADIILPVCSFLEFSDFIPHPYPYIQLQQKVIEPLYESKSDADIVEGLAERLGFGNYISGGEEGLIDIITDHPSLKGYDRETLKKGPKLLQELPEGSNFPLTFSTPSGKIEIYAEQLVEDGQALPVYLPPLESPINGEELEYPLAFVQGHSRFRTHSSFANVQSLLDLNPEPFVDINPIDAKKRDIKTNDLVTVYNDRARTTLKARVNPMVHPGIIDITEGWWIDQFKEGSVNHLTHDVINPVQEKIYEPNMHMNDVAVEVIKANEGEK